MGTTRFRFEFSLGAGIQSKRPYSCKPRSNGYYRRRWLQTQWPTSVRSTSSACVRSTRLLRIVKTLPHVDRMRVWNNSHEHLIGDIPTSDRQGIVVGGSLDLHGGPQRSTSLATIPHWQFGASAQTVKAEWQLHQPYAASPVTSSMHVHKPWRSMPPFLEYVATFQRAPLECRLGRPLSPIATTSVQACGGSFADDFFPT